MLLTRSVLLDTFLTQYLLSFLLIFLGCLLIFLKYRIVIGSKLVKAKIHSIAEIHRDAEFYDQENINREKFTGLHTECYSRVIEFEYKGEVKRINLSEEIHSLARAQRSLDKKMWVYYNPKHFTRVLKLRWGSEIGAMVLFATAAFLLFG